MCLLLDGHKGRDRRATKESSKSCAPALHPSNPSIGNALHRRSGLLPAWLDLPLGARPLFALFSLVYFDVEAAIMALHTYFLFPNLPGPELGRFRSSIAS
jgi:hypothetical protein